MGAKNSVSNPEPQNCRAVINVGSNDYRGDSFVDNPNCPQALEEAKKLSRAYLYWLQTEAPREEGGIGYSENRPMPEANGTPDGLAHGPFVREGRRLRACESVVEEYLSTQFQTGSCARQFVEKKPKGTTPMTG